MNHIKRAKFKLICLKAYQMRFGEACHERIQSGLKFKDHQKAEKVIKLIHDANFLLRVSPKYA